MKLMTDVVQELSISPTFINLLNKNRFHLIAHDTLVYIYHKHIPVWYAHGCTRVYTFNEWVAIDIVQ